MADKIFKRTSNVIRRQLIWGTNVPKTTKLGNLRFNALLVKTLMIIKRNENIMTFYTIFHFSGFKDIVCVLISCCESAQWGYEFHSNYFKRNVSMKTRYLKCSYQSLYNCFWGFRNKIYGFWIKVPNIYGLNIYSSTNISCVLI